MVYLCSLCGDFGSRYFVKVLRHIGAVHSYEPHFQVQCGIDSCPKTYKKYTSWRKHILRQHKHIFRDDVEPRDEHCQPSFSEDCDRDNEEEFDRPTCTSLQLAAISGNRLSVENSLENSFGRQKAALFLLKAKECLKVSQSALESLIGDVSSISSAQVQILRNKVTEFLSSKNMPVDIQDGINDIFTQSESRPLFDGLASAYSQNKYFVDHLGLVVSLDFRL